MAVDTKKNTKPDATKEANMGMGPGSQGHAMELAKGHKAGDVFKKHAKNSTNDNAPGGLIPDLGE